MSQEEVTQLVLDYLQENGNIEAMRALERSSNVLCDDYGQVTSPVSMKTSLQY